MRRPAASILAFTAPVKLRRVTSGLRIENVCSMAMDARSTASRRVIVRCGAYSERVSAPQGAPARVSVARDLSGLGSTRCVNRSGISEPATKARQPEPEIHPPGTVLDGIDGHATMEG